MSELKKLCDLLADRCHYRILTYVKDGYIGVELQYNPYSFKIARKTRDLDYDLFTIDVDELPFRMTSVHRTNHGYMSGEVYKSQAREAWHAVRAALPYLIKELGLTDDAE